MRAGLLTALPLLIGAAEPQSIEVSQLGFAPGDAKIAILRVSGAPRGWALTDAQNRIVARGKAVVFGKDAASGAEVQRIDFSSFRAPGEGYRIVVGAVSSDAFAIRAGIYRPLARDALAFFYHQRAGIPIEARFVGAKWARPAGHAREVAKCFLGKDERGRVWDGCGYALDVTGGWYDAGDHGKYVVNGGISLWTLLNAYERRPAAFADGSLAIPESGNGRSDLLDEARYEMEFLLRMQIADGVRMRIPVGAANTDFTEIDAGGMAHQKVADRNWTSLPTPPHADREERLLYPPTTAATLNLAAVAAQSARLWRGVDDAFAVRCLRAAERAWAAAQRNPEVFATNSFTGSGGYGDGDASDEFYWAAGELYATTRAPRYLDAVRASPHFTATVTEPGWPRVAALGTITLATIAKLDQAETRRLRGGIVAAADGFLGDRERTGYRIPYPAANYPWGSNSNLLNRAMLLATAHDFTGEDKYRNGVVDAVGYVLGRNPMRVSYVSGYGARSMQHPHHRFWAPSLEPKLPGPPSGTLSGGPNSTAMSDDVAAKLKGKCAPQTCWADHVDAYALNEVAINWNAPLFWVAGWLAE